MVENSTDNRPLSSRQLRAVQALVTCPTVTEAARQAGVGTSTLWRWRREVPAFAQALTAAQREAIAGLSRALAALGEKAVQAISDALEPDQRMEFRLRAAAIVTSNVGDAGEVELEARLSELERRLGA